MADPDKFRELFASPTAGTSEDAQGILDCAHLYGMTEDQRADVLSLKLALQKAELRKRGR